MIITVLPLITFQIDPGTVASDGFMLNVTAVLTRLCEPFMDIAYSKVRIPHSTYFIDMFKLIIYTDWEG